MLLFMQIEDVRIARGFFKEKCKPQCICIGVGTRLFEIKELVFSQNPITLFANFS